jgi:hypothetical protein
MLKFSYHNQKLNELARWLGVPLNQVISFDLPAGWTCQKANICKTFTARDTGRVKQVGRIKCYASKAECYAPNTRVMRWHNFDSILPYKNDKNKIVNLLTESLPIQAKIVRIHSSGDFFSRAYFQAWVEFSSMNPDVIFYGYTKHLNYAISPLPDNMRLEYSYGSLDDNKMESLGYHVPTCFIGEIGRAHV